MAPGIVSANMDHIKTVKNSKEGIIWGWIHIGHPCQEKPPNFRKKIWRFLLRTFSGTRGVSWAATRMNTGMYPAHFLD